MKRLLKLSVLLSSAILLFTAQKCGEEKNQYTEASQIDMVKTGCFGSCPVYNFSIKGNGEATFNGRRFVDLEGEYERVFSADTANLIFNTFVEANLWQYENEYTEEVTDLPTTYLTFQHEGKTKKIKLYYGIPEALRTLTDQLQEIAFSKGWTPEGKVETE